MIEIFQKFNTADQTLNNIIEKINKTEFLSELNSIYKYLDNLSLLEESALFHIIAIFFILCTITNIYSVLFANEIIKYFKLVENYPKLKKYF